MIAIFDYGAGNLRSVENTLQSLGARYQIVRDAALGTRLADKLMKVWRRDGVEQMVLVHTEIQGSRNRDFAKRFAKLWGVA